MALQKYYTCSFKLVLEGEIGKEIPDSSRLEFLEKFLTNDFALSDAKDNTSGLLNRQGIADCPLFRTIIYLNRFNRFFRRGTTLSQGEEEILGIFE